MKGLFTKARGNGGRAAKSQKCPLLQSRDYVSRVLKKQQQQQQQKNKPHTHTHTHMQGRKTLRAGSCPIQITSYQNQMVSFCQSLRTL